MKQLIIILLSLIAMTSLVLLMSRQPQKTAIKIDPVKVMTDSLISPEQPVIARNSDSLIR